MSDYTPSTDEVRINYIGTHPSLATSPHQVERPGEFDRWLESVRAEERERIARNIEARVVVDSPICYDWNIATRNAARIARESA